MKTFMDKDFLLQTETARELYHDHAAKMPIIDYHCHLDPKMVAEDHRFRSITELWLGGDHYKWRALRANGVNERYITGTDTGDWEKFEKWAETIPYTFRNPLYHWTHLELRTAFGIQKILNPQNAREIFDACNEKLKQPDFSARGLMRRYNVESVCTTDDPTDTLKHHQSIRESGFEVKVLPTWRPDKAMAVADAKSYRAYVERLAAASDVHIATYDDLLTALRRRHDYFGQQGCRLADHGVSEFPVYNPKTDARALFDKVYGGTELDPQDILELQAAIFIELARMNWEKGWVQQIHFGPLRNTNTRMFRALGPDTGFDSIGDFRSVQSICNILDVLDSDNQLAKTILYNLNPADNDATAALIGNYQDGSVAGKMQFGSAWWFNDQIDGMERQLNALSLQGLLSRFVGMLTDSRSFLSYPRHEYFRRVLCNLLGRDVEEGLIPASELPRVEQMTEDICYYNAKNYFGF